MATVSRALRTDHPAVAFVLRVVILVLTLATAAIHASLGGLLFTLNAVGYTVLAALMVLPGPVAPVRWLVRLALLGFVAATIGGWVLFGAPASHWRTSTRGSRSCSSASSCSRCG